MKIKRLSEKEITVFHEAQHIGGGQTFVNLLLQNLRRAYKKVVIVESTVFKNFFLLLRTPILIVNIYSPKYLWLLCIRSCLNKKKTLVVVHGIWYLEQRSRTLKQWSASILWLRLAQELVFLLATKMVVLSHYTQTLIFQNFWWSQNSQSKITLIPGVTALSSLKNRSHKKTPRIIQFCTVARIEYRKGLFELLEAFALTLKKYPQIQLNLVLAVDDYAQSELTAELLAWATKLGCAANLRWFANANVHQVAEIYLHADCFILSSLDLETFGFVTLEALSHGLPVIGFETGATAEVLGPLFKNFLAKQVSPIALSAKLKWYCGLSAATKKNNRLVALRRAKHFNSAAFLYRWRAVLD
jgi:glycosyltransferase involved in cell wall biosynthesis